MAQITQVIQADPWKLADDITALAATNQIQIITKTFSAGKFLVTSDNAAPTGQTAEVVAGDPDKLKADIDALILGGALIEIVTPTFSSAHYVVVYS